MRQKLTHRADTLRHVEYNHRSAVTKHVTVRERAVNPSVLRVLLKAQIEELPGESTEDARLALGLRQSNQRAHIERILRETQHNLSRAARILDIDRTTLYNKLRRYGLR